MSPSQRSVCDCYIRILYCIVLYCIVCWRQQQQTMDKLRCLSTRPVSRVRMFFLNRCNSVSVWLGVVLLQQLVEVNVSEVPLASARINVSETARDLGVTLTSSSTASWRCLRRWPPCVAVAATSYGSSDRSSDTCQLTSWRSWSKHSSHVAWTTATHFSTAYLTDNDSAAISPVSGTLLRVWCPVLTFFYSQ